MKSPKTLQEAMLYFADYERCRQFLIDLRWPDGTVTCPQCGSDHVVYLEKARVWKCYGKHSHAKFSLKTGTIFEDSPLGLDKWLAALWLVVNCKNGISSCEIARDLGITQKSAWFMAHRLRLALHYGSFDMLSGEVEVDETFIGGKARNMHVAQRKRRITGTGGKGKTAVMGILQRDGSASALARIDPGLLAKNGPLDADRGACSMGGWAGNDRAVSVATGLSPTLMSEPVSERARRRRARWPGGRTPKPSGADAILTTSPPTVFSVAASPTKPAFP